MEVNVWEVGMEAPFLTGCVGSRCTSPSQVAF